MKCCKLMVLCLCMAAFSCKHPQTNPNQDMVDRLTRQAKFEDNADNPYAVGAVLKHLDSVILHSPNGINLFPFYIKKANTFLQMGQEKKAVAVLDSLNNTFIVDYSQRKIVLKNLALAYMRLGERTNCIINHSAESCLFPISGGGVHKNKEPAEKAIELYEKILKEDDGDYESRWLLNIAYMTIGGYPQKVPAPYLFNMANNATYPGIKPFKDVAMSLGLDVKKLGGGAIIDDFDNDGYPDIITSSTSLTEHMHYLHNNKDGTFKDISKSSSIGMFTGGLNIMQTDYNNDGFKDIFVLRGAWRDKFGKEPNSLLRNNGDGTFTDVTAQSGLLSFHPTQTAVWADFNNDGWLDVFIGNESSDNNLNPSELYINNKNGTFTEMAADAGCDIKLFVKGVTAGDYNNDGLTDIFISTMNGNKILLKNITPKNGKVKFEDVSATAKLNTNYSTTFGTCFFDFDNDGWPDILICGYGNNSPIGYIAGAEALNRYQGNDGKVILYHNEHNGTFKDVSKTTGFDKISFAMGFNFGDIDNDGWPDIYLGTGNPLFTSLIPNKLYKNIGGKYFADVTTSARVGSLQKGHGISFADMDNDGTEDIYINQGGAFPGDAYQNALYINPGQNNNHWLNICLQGTQSNKAAIGAKIKVTFTDKGVQRSVYRTVNSGGSFGSNPLKQHIGLGSATKVDTLQILWPVTGDLQVFTHVMVDVNLKITEGSKTFSTYKLSKFKFNSMPSVCITTGIK